MSETENIPTDTEREQIEDDIERLKLALQEEDEINDSDDEDALHIDEGPKPGPSSASGSASHYDHKNKDGTVDDKQPGSTDHVLVSEDDQDIPISPETCLALNRVYQDILLDSLRRIEIALSENRAKQVTLEQGLEELTRKTSKTDSSQPQNIKKPLTSFHKPYFKDINGRFAPDNEDYKMKIVLEECKQDVAAPATWYQKQRELLRAAVVREAMQQRLRPFMNSKEIKCEKYMKADKDNEEEQKQKMKEQIEYIDREIDKIKNMPTDDLLTDMDYDSIDWLKISSSDFHGKRDVEDCKKMWMNVLRPGINKEPWIEEESKLLVELVARHNMKEWNLIAEELGTGRTAFQCLQYYQQNFNEAYNKREWTQEEDDLLGEVVENCKTGDRITWNQVAYFIEGRSATQCLARWHQIDPAIRHGKWTVEEDCLLLSAVHLYGTSDWFKLAAAVPNRNIIQCRDRYLNCLDPRLKPPSKWTYDEDKRLLQLVMKYNINGNIKWVKIAEEMEGRTDHMVMTRYKRLMSWQAKCDWVESQDEETKKMLGTVTLKKPQKILPKKSGGKKKKEERERMDMALNLAQFASGVQRQDYQRQATDKESGDIIVPRPPLSYNYSNRSSNKVWKHKVQLKKMVEDHISNKLMKEMSAEEKLDLPAKTAAEFKPYFNASKSAKNIMDKILETRNPSSLSVADILAMTKSCERHGKKVVNRMKRLGRDAKLEKQIKEIIMTKTYSNLPTAKRAGRPKKINLFFPFGRKPQFYEETENVAQLTSVSTNLMLTALEVNGRKALNNAKVKDQSKLTASEKEDMALLKKLFPPLPSSMPKTQHIVVKSVSPLLPVPPSPRRPGEQKSKEGKVDTVKALTDKKLASSVDKKAEKTRKIKKEQAEIKDTQTSHGKGPVKNMPLPKGDNSVGTVSNTPQGTLTNTKLKAGQRVIQLPAGTVIPKGKTGTILQMPSGKITLKPGQKIVKVSSPKVQTLTANPQQTKTLESAASPTPVVITQKTGKPSPENIPMLPPGMKNLRGFASLLLQRKLLMARAKDKYNVKVYQRQMFEINEVAKLTNKSKKAVEENVEDVDLSNTLHAYKEAGNQIMKGAGCIENKIYKSEENTLTSWHDPLSSIRQTEEYQLLKKRFQGLFVWPSLLSTIQPPEDHLDDEEINSGKEDDMDQDTATNVQFRKGISMKECSSSVMERAIDKTSQSFVKRMKSRIDKKKYQRKQYPCSNGKHYYRHILKNREWKKNVTKKRLMCIKLRKEGVIEPKVPKQRKHRKRYQDLEKRSSLRLANKQLSVNLMKAESLKSPKASKTTPLEKCSQTNKKQRKKFYHSISKRFMPLDDTESNGNHGDNEDGPSMAKRSRMVQNENDVESIKIEATDEGFPTENIPVTTSAYQPQIVKPDLGELVTNQLACMASESSTNLLQNLSNQLSMLQEGGLIPVIMGGTQPTQQVAATGNIPVTNAAQGQTTPNTSLGEAMTSICTPQTVGQNLGIPGLDGHVLLAVPVSQLAGGLINPQAGSGGIYPVNLVMNSSAMVTTSQHIPAVNIPSTNSEPVLLSTSSQQVISSSDACATSVTPQTEVREITPTTVKESRDTASAANTEDTTVTLLKTERKEDTDCTSASESSQVSPESGSVTNS